MLDTWIRQSSSHFQYLNAALTAIESDYDYVIIDTKGADGTGEMQEMAIRACDELLSPISPQWIAVQEFVRGTVDMLKRLEPPPGIQTGIQPIPPMQGIIYALDQTADARNVAQQLRKTFYSESKGKVSVMDTVVPNVAAYNQATGRRMPAHRFEVKRYNSPTPSAYQTMLALAHELLPALSDVTPNWDKTKTRKQGAGHG
ncbi:MAG TPA: ParA family protein [Anaerolineae bacterium]|nr:ParA family protein [Anaerolineae bacterium]